MLYIPQIDRIANACLISRKPCISEYISSSSKVRRMREKKKEKSGRDVWMIARDATKLEEFGSPAVPIKSRVVEIVRRRSFPFFAAVKFYHGKKQTGRKKTCRFGSALLI